MLRVIVWRSSSALARGTAACFTRNASTSLPDSGWQKESLKKPRVQSQKTLSSTKLRATRAVGESARFVPGAEAKREVSRGALPSQREQFEEVKREKAYLASQEKFRNRSNLAGRDRSYQKVESTGVDYVPRTRVSDRQAQVTKRLHRNDKEEYSQTHYGESDPEPNVAHAFDRLRPNESAVFERMLTRSRRRTDVLPPNAKSKDDRLTEDTSAMFRRSTGDTTIDVDRPPELGEFKGKISSACEKSTIANDLKRALEGASSTAVASVFTEFIEAFDDLIKSSEGSLVLQQLFTVATPEQHVQLMACLEGKFVTLALHDYACYAVEKALVTFPAAYLASVEKELKGQVVALASDMNGSHVLENVLKRASQATQELAIEEVRLAGVEPLAKHVYTHHIICQLLQHGPISCVEHLFADLLPHFGALAVHAQANYVARAMFRSATVSPDSKEKLYERLLADEGALLLHLMRHSHGTFVAREALQKGTSNQKLQCAQLLRKHDEELRRDPNAKVTLARCGSILNKASRGVRTFKVEDGTHVATNDNDHTSGTRRASEVSADTEFSMKLGAKMNAAMTNAIERERIGNTVLKACTQLVHSDRGCLTIVEWLSSIANEEERRTLFATILPSVPELITAAHATILFEKLLTVADSPQRSTLIALFKGQVARYATQEHACAVLRKVSEVCSPSELAWIVDEVLAQYDDLCTHEHGSRLVAHLFSTTEPEQRARLIAKLCESVQLWCTDAYASIVADRFLNSCSVEERSQFIDAFMTADERHIFAIKHVSLRAAHLLEKCLELGTHQEKQRVIRRMLTTTKDVKPLNWVFSHPRLVEAMLAAVERSARPALLDMLRPAFDMAVKSSRAEKRNGAAAVAKHFGVTGAPTVMTRMEQQSSEQRIVALIDMDCFFAQVEQRERPELWGKPMAVVGNNSFGEGGVIAMSYEAKQFGVTRWMKAKDAQKLCADITLIPIGVSRTKQDISKYAAASEEIFNILYAFTRLGDVVVEHASVDEAYLDLTKHVERQLASGALLPHVTDLPSSYVIVDVAKQIEANRESTLRVWLDKAKNDLEQRNATLDAKLALAAKFVEEIRAQILRETKFHCSAGIGHNKMLAKVCCGVHKPKRQTVLPASGVSALFSEVNIQKIRSLGGKFGARVCEKYGITKMIELMVKPKIDLVRDFGEKDGNWLYLAAQGMDDEPVAVRQISKSIGSSKNFGVSKAALSLRSHVLQWLTELAEELESRLLYDQKRNVRTARTLSVGCRVVQKSTVAGEKMTAVSYTRTFPLCSYAPDRMANDAISKLKEFNEVKDGSDKWHPPIAFLSLSASNFEDGVDLGMPSITEYFRTVPGEMATVAPSTATLRKAPATTTADTDSHTLSNKRDLLAWFTKADGGNSNDSAQRMDVQIQDGQSSKIDHCSDSDASVSYAYNDAPMRILNDDLSSDGSLSRGDNNLPDEGAKSMLEPAPHASSAVAEMNVAELDAVPILIDMDTWDAMPNEMRWEFRQHNPVRADGSSKNPASSSAKQPTQVRIDSSSKSPASSGIKRPASADAATKRKSPKVSSRKNDTTSRTDGDILRFVRRT